MSAVNDGTQSRPPGRRSISAFFLALVMRLGDALGVFVLGVVLYWLYFGLNPTRISIGR